MTTQSRKERDRLQRHRLIISTARELAETDGWDAVTTRRLSECIEYSQPVLYSHFRGKQAIMDAVAVEGGAQLAAEMREARTRNPQRRLAAVAAAYMEFGRRAPATFEAMFTRPSGLSFGPQAPQELKDAFTELLIVFETIADGRDPQTLTEVGWSAIHGLAILDYSGRLRPEHADQRLAMLVEQLTAPAGG